MGISRTIKDKTIKQIKETILNKIILNQIKDINSRDIKIKVTMATGKVISSRNSRCMNREEVVDTTSMCHNNKEEVEGAEETMGISNNSNTNNSSNRMNIMDMRELKTSTRMTTRT
jgi:hypothetical protein